MFRKAETAQLASFNSDASCQLLEIIERTVKQDIQAQGFRPKSRTFAPSAMRCKRKSWFRLRGAEPDIISEPDTVMDFTAMLGTAIHQYVQEKLSKALGADWIDVEEYLREFPISYKYTLQKSGYETLVEIEDPPVRFAVDGILRLSGMYRLLEIKSSEYDSWHSLSTFKGHHRDQIEVYSTILNLPDVLTLYVDRQYGGMKSYEHRVTETEMCSVRQGMRYVQQMADACIAPERLPTGDYMCSNCEYKIKCREW